MICELPRVAYDPQWTISLTAFQRSRLKKHYKKIKAITRTMGAVRDLDVLIARFQNELTNLTAVEQADIRGLIEHLQRKRKEAREPMLTLFEGLEETGFETEFLDLVEEVNQSA